MSEKEFRLGGDLIGSRCPRCNGAGRLPSKKRIDDQWHTGESPCYECRGIGWNLTPTGKTLVDLIRNSLLADEHFKNQLDLGNEVDSFLITQPED